MNCGQVLSGAYCSACGQESRIQTPTVGEFVREFVQDQMALEGKLLRTLKLLLTRPGALTLDYISGRRQCYIRPLRLYLALSVVFFAISGLVGHHAWMQADPGDEDKPLFTQKSDAVQAPAAGTAGGGKAGPAASAGQDESGAAKLPDGGFDGMRDFKTGYSLLDARIHAYFSQTQKQAGAQLSRAIDNDAPVAMFFLLPLFAGLLQLAYLRHHLRYGVHLLFSLHYHAFVFLDLLVQEIPWPSIANAVLNVAIPVYLVMALLLVYAILIGITLFAAAVISIIISG